MRSATLLRRAIRAELATLSWRRGVFWAAIPLALLIPVVITVAIAKANEYISEVNAHVGPDEVPLPGGYSMSRDNSFYWVLFLSTFIMMCAAASSYGTQYRNRTVDTFAVIQPQRWPLPTAKLAVYGVLAAVTTAVGVVIVNGLIPMWFPRTWAEVSLVSSEGIRALWTLPLYSFFLVAFGLGLVGLLRSTFISVALVLFAKLGTEAFLVVGDADTADLIRHYSPLSNAEYSTGQVMGVAEGMWSVNTAIVYYVTVFLVVFALGVLRFSRINSR